jgi:hypothetical protein
VKILRVVKYIGLNRVFLRRQISRIQGGFSPHAAVVYMMEWEDQLLDSWRLARSCGYFAHSAALFQARQAIQRAQKYVHEYLDLVRATEDPLEHEHDRMA